MPANMSCQSLRDRGQNNFHSENHITHISLIVLMKKNEVTVLIRLSSWFPSLPCFLACFFGLEEFQNELTPGGGSRCARFLLPARAGGSLAGGRFRSLTGGLPGLVRLEESRYGQQQEKQYNDATKEDHFPACSCSGGLAPLSPKCVYGKSCASLNRGA